MNFPNRDRDMNSAVHRILLSLATLCLFAGPAFGGIIVGDAPLPMPDFSDPDTVYPVSVSYEGDFTVDAFGRSTTDNGNTLFGGLFGFVYDDGSQNFLVGNQSRANSVKTVWFHMKYTSEEELPQLPGETFTPDEWPTIDPAGTEVTTLTAASAIAGENGIDNEIYMTWTISPTPAFEAIVLDFPKLNDNFGGVSLVEVKTVSQVVPEPSAFLVWAVLGLALTRTCWRRRRK